MASLAGSNASTADVLVATTNCEDDPNARDEDSRAALRAVRNGVELADDLWVGRCPDATRVIDACGLRGDKFSPRRQFGEYYTLIRHNPPGPDGCRWDPDQRLRRAVVFSRLVHFTPTGYRYRARVQRDADGSITGIMPFCGPPAFAGDLSRPWLTRNEWLTVRSLLCRWDSSVEPAAKRLPRFHSALWYVEKAALEEESAQRWVLVATAIEALVGEEWQARGGTGGRGRRFRDGLLKLTQECGQTLQEADAREAWERRSAVVHGAGLPPLAGQAGPFPDPLYGRVESTVATTLRKMIESDEFAGDFADDNKVEAWLSGSADAERSER